MAAADAVAFCFSECVVGYRKLVANLIFFSETSWSRELSVKRLDDRASEYSNHIHASATDEFIEFLKTPNFAKSIERKALRPAK